MDFPNEQNKLFQNKREQKIVFFLVSVGIFTITYGVLFVIDFLPEKPSEDAESKTAVFVDDQITVLDTVEVIDEADEPAIVSDDSAVAEPAQLVPTEEALAYEEVLQVKAPAPADIVATAYDTPTKIIFDDLGGREVNVLNPSSRSIADLDNALLNGVVRHPDSADFSRTGTMFLFGHSSYLPNVFNKNFQAFNGIQELTWGDKIRLQSEDTEYVYRVDRVYQAKASAAEVEIETGKSKLTLATCNSFGSTDDRYIVESTLVDSYPISG